MTIFDYYVGQALVAILSREIKGGRFDSSSPMSNDENEQLAYEARRLADAVAKEVCEYRAHEWSDDKWECARCGEAQPRHAVVDER